MTHFKQPHEDLIKNIKHNLESDLHFLTPARGGGGNAPLSAVESKYLVENVLKSMEESPLRS